MTIKRELLKHFVESVKDDSETVMAERLIDLARPQDHPLHKEFTWNDRKAAEERRLEQARKLIQRAGVVIVVSNRVFQGPGYVKDPTVPHQQPGYRAVEALARVRHNCVASLEAEISAIAALVWRGRMLALQYATARKEPDLVELFEENLAEVVAKGPINQPEPVVRPHTKRAKARGARA